MPGLFSFQSRTEQPGKKRSKLLPFQLHLPTSLTLEQPGSGKLRPFQLSSLNSGTPPPISEKSHANPSGPSHATWQTAGISTSSSVVPDHDVGRPISDPAVFLPPSDSPAPSFIPFPKGPPPVRRGRTRSLRVDNTGRSRHPSRPLSPIEEQEYMSPDKIPIWLPSHGNDTPRGAHEIASSDASRIYCFLSFPCPYLTW
jgi:hypothetical protein